MRAIGERVSVKDATFQKLRASCATMMEAAGCGAAQVKRQLRHSSVGVTEGHYMMADKVEMQRAMERFGY
jgi:integrase